MLELVRRHEPENLFGVVPPFRAYLAAPFARIPCLSFNCRFSRGSLVSFSHSSVLGTSQCFAAVGFGALNPVADRVRRGLELLGELIGVRPMSANWVSFRRNFGE